MTMSSRLLAASPLAWALECVRISTPSGMQSFQPYGYQAAILADRAPRLLVLKARQVGLSLTAAISLAHMALYQPRSVSLVVSRDQGAAANVLGTVYEILDGLAESPGFERRDVYQCLLGNGARIVSQPATAKAGRGLTATQVVLDEAAFMEYDAQIVRSVQPTLSRGGRLMVLSTPNGINNWFYRAWSGDEGGQWSRHRVHYTDCPVFTPEWAEKEKANHTAQSWASEYDCSFVESGGAAFNLADIEAMPFGWTGEQAAIPGHYYVTGWDIGRRRDATVGITIDSTQQPYQLVKYERLMRAPFAQIQAAIVRRDEDYGGQTLVEANSIGDPVIEGLGISVTPFMTTAASKANILTKLIRLVEQQQLKAGAEQLLSELRSYQWDDSKLIQDSVMALAIACSGLVESQGSTARLIQALTSEDVSGRHAWDLTREQREARNQDADGPRDGLLTASYGRDF